MLSVPTSTFNCPVCKQGKLVITEINHITFAPNEEHTFPAKIDITGLCVCNNCGATYELHSKDTTMR